MQNPIPTLAALVVAALVAATSGLAEEARAAARWISGGVGDESREALDASSGDYSLKIVFAVQQHQAYLSSVPFVIRDRGGATVAEGETEGPWLLVDLPAGSYEVEATAEGETRRQDVSVGASGQTQVAFHFTGEAPASDASASR